VLLLWAVLGAACGRGPTGAHDPRLLAVTPAFGRTDAPLEVELLGENFVRRVAQRLDGPGGLEVDAGYQAHLGEVALLDVRWVDAGRLRARVPAGLAPGWHALTVISPLGRSVRLEQAFFASDVPGAQLSAGAQAEPSPVAVGEDVRLTLTVTNAGGRKALAVTPSLALEGGGVADPGPATPPSRDVAPGRTASFTWRLVAPRAGALTARFALVAQEEGSDRPLALPDAAGVVLQVQEPARLEASLLPASATLQVGQRLRLELTVRNAGEGAARGLTPGLQVSRPPLLAVREAPAPADVPGGTAHTFAWLLEAVGEGALTVLPSVEGTDALTGRRVSAAPAAALQVQVASEVQPLATDPTGDGATFAYVFSHAGRVYVGPSRSGGGGARFLPDGTGAESFTFTFTRDTSGNEHENRTPAAYTSIGAPGCAADTAACGPDDESGRGLFFSGTWAGDATPWLGVAGARPQGDFDYLYFTPDTDGTLDFRHADVSQAMGGNTLTPSAAHFHGGRLYVGATDSGGNRPYLAVLKRAPPPGGLDYATAGDLEDLAGEDLPSVGGGGTPRNGAPVIGIDAMATFNDRLYVANNGGCARSTAATPVSASSSGTWADCTPTAWLDTDSLFPATGELTPALRTVPAMAVFQGRLYLARNTNNGPQLYACTPAATGAPADCEPQDWAPVAPNTSNNTALTQLEDTGNTRITLLLATARHLYVGFNNPAGAHVYRTASSTPAAVGDFTGRGGCLAGTAGCVGLGGQGLGAGADVTQLHASTVLTDAGRDFVYLTAGTAASAVRVLRLGD
jgi:hypothetical protein